MTAPDTLDPAALNRLRTWGGEKLLQEILAIFIANSPARMDQIRSGLEGDDPKEVERGAHSLKSTAANVGATRVQLLSTEFEDIAGSGRIDGLRERLPELEEAYARAIEALEAVAKGAGE